MSPFDIANTIRSTKKYIMGTEIEERDYNSFMINRALSYHRDALMYAQEMNLNPGLTAQMQYDYLFYSIRQNKTRERARWGKKEKSSDIEAIMDYYQYGYRKAVEVSKILNSTHISYIKGKLYRGD